MKDETIVGLVTSVLLLVLWSLVGGLALEYTVEFWGSHITGSPVDIPFLVCAVAGFFLVRFAVPLAMITWVASYFVV